MKMTEQTFTLITHNPSFNHLVYIINQSRSQDAIISKTKSIIDTVSVAKFDLAVKYVKVNTRLSFEQFKHIPEFHT